MERQVNIAGLMPEGWANPEMQPQITWKTRWDAAQTNRLHYRVMELPEKSLDTFSLIHIQTISGETTIYKRVGTPILKLTLCFRLAFFYFKINH